MRSPVIYQRVQIPNFRSSKAHCAAIRCNARQIGNKDIISNTQRNRVASRPDFVVTKRGSNRLRAPPAKRAKRTSTNHQPKQIESLSDSICVKLGAIQSLRTNPDFESLPDSKSSRPSAAASASGRSPVFIICLVIWERVRYNEGNRCIGGTPCH